MSFLILACAQLFHVFNMSEPASKLFVNEVTTNRWVWGAIALCALLIAGGVYLPGVQDVLEVQPPGLTDWAIVLGAASVPLVVGRVVAAIRG
jgi:Ca2+-transporting ATPase